MKTLHQTGHPRTSMKSASTSRQTAKSYIESATTAWFAGKLSSSKRHAAAASTIDEIGI